MNQQREIRIPIGDAIVEGNLTLSHNVQGIVVFAHGSGSSRFSSRNQYVARYFNNQKIGTLLFDLLTPREEEIDLVTAEYRFNIDLLAHRLIGATEWLRTDQETKSFKLGYFGASTGAAAALIAAAELPDAVAAVVSRGGRPDLAGDHLARVKAPTLLLVGGWDNEVLRLNRIAQSQMVNLNKLEIIPEATHLFEEPGKLEEVAKFSARWFERYLR
jgi:pimeloyl-ACP methyl ester carboxylesterase